MEKKNENFTDEEELKKAQQLFVSYIVAKKESGETLSTDEQLIYDTHKKVLKEESSWFARNAWFIALGVAIFFLKMCSDLSK